MILSNGQSCHAQISETPLLKVGNILMPSDIKVHHQSHFVWPVGKVISNKYKNVLGSSNDESIDGEPDVCTSDEDEKAEVQETIPDIQEEIYKYVNKVYSDQSMLLKTMESNITDSIRSELNDAINKLKEMGESIAVINGRLTVDEESIENIKQRIDDLKKIKTIKTDWLKENENNIEKTSEEEILVPIK